MIITTASQSIIIANISYRRNYKRPDYGRTGPFDSRSCYSILWLEMALSRNDFPDERISTLRIVTRSNE